jgi:hypothetical protein
MELVANLMIFLGVKSLSRSNFPKSFDRIAYFVTSGVLDALHFLCNQGNQNPVSSYKKHFHSYL